MTERDAQSSDEAEQDEPSKVTCFDCEREVSVRSSVRREVMVPHDDGLGYDYVRVPLCPGCAYDRFGVECDICGEQFPDVDYLNEHHIAEHTDPEPIPDGGSRETVVGQR
jgi:hypothetical protein